MAEAFPFFASEFLFVYVQQGAPEGVSEESVVASLKNASVTWDQCRGQNTFILKRDLSPSVAGLKVTAALQMQMR